MSWDVGLWIVGLILVPLYACNNHHIEGLDSSYIVG